MKFRFFRFIFCFCLFFPLSFLFFWGGGRGALFVGGLSFFHIFFFSVLVGLGFVFLWWLICFLFSSLFCFLNLTCKQTYDTWRLGHVVPDDVVIADIGDQVLDIFLHGPESTHKNGIGKTFTRTSIPIQPCTLLKQTKSKTLNSPNMTPSISCPLPVQCSGRRPPESLADALQDWSTSKVFSLGQYWQKIFVDVFNKYKK